MKLVLQGELTAKLNGFTKRASLVKQIRFTSEARKINPKNP